MIENLNDFYNVFYKIEKEEGLLKKKKGGIYFYKLIRAILFDEIAIKLNLEKQLHDSISLYYVTKNFFKKFLKNFFRKEEKYIDVILFDNNRFYYNDNEYKSIYLNDIMKKLEKDKINYKIIQPWNTDIKYNNKKCAKVSMNLFIFTSINIFIFSILKILNLKINRDMFGIEKKINNTFNINININNLIIKEILKFKINYKYYLKYFSKKQVKKIYLICSYGKEGIISAAQDLNIEVIEIQHGVFNKYHLGYNFKGEEVAYFPDKLLIFGNYWKKLEIFPLNTKIEIYGFPYLEAQLNKYKQIKRKQNQIIFISQGSIGNILSKKAVSFALENPNIKVVYRLHPGEFLRWEKEYKELYENRKLKNLEISDNNKKNLYEYLYESNYLIGVSSTVIYEALAVGIKIGILELYSYEFFSDLIEKKIVYLFKKEEKIDLKKLENLKKIDRNYFFNKNLNNT